MPSLKGGYTAAKNFLPPSIPEGQDGCAASTMSSLIIMVVHKYKGSVSRHKTPTFSPVPTFQKSKLLFHNA